MLNSDTARAKALIALQGAEDAYEKAENYRKELNGKIKIRDVRYVRVNGVLVPQVKEYKGYADAETIADADAKLALAKAQLDDARREYDRVKEGPNVADIAAAQARVDAAQATLNLARIIAPFSGMITESKPLPGDQVGAGASAFRLDDLTSLYVDVEVSEVDINSVSPGQLVTLSFDAILGRDYHGKVVEVVRAGSIQQGVVNFTVTVELIDADELVKPSNVRLGAGIFDLDLTLIGRKIEENPWIARAEVIRSLPDEVVITVTEHEPRAIVQLDYLYYVNAAGEVFKLLDSGDRLDYPIITGIDRQFLLDNPADGQAWLRQALVLVARLQERRLFSLADVSEIQIDLEAGLVVHTREHGVPVLFGQDAFDDKLDRLERIYAEQKPRLTALHYIDLNAFHLHDGDAACCMCSLTGGTGTYSGRHITH